MPTSFCDWYLSTIKMVAKFEIFSIYSTEFVGDVSSLTEIADGFIEVIDAVANEVTKEKVKVIGARNRLQTIAKERETQVCKVTYT